MTCPPQPVLIIYSHGRNPPLNPTPDLKYDLRSIPNPPKALRDVSDGRSKRLREHLMAEPQFTTKLDVVEEEIRNAMKSKIAEHNTRVDSVPVDAENSVENDGDVTLQLSKEDDDEEKSEDEQGRETIALRVGCNCALGHHRSVAFVCELASRAWPKDWVVEVVHRDLEKKRSGSAREKQKASWKGRRGRKIAGGEQNPDWDE